MGDYTFQIEDFEAAYEEYVALSRMHFCEIEDYRTSLGLPERAFDLDLACYVPHARIGQLIAYTARCNGDPVGYLLVYLTRDHRSGAIYAIEDCLFVHPDHRTGVGRKLIEFAVRDLSDKPNVERFEVTAAGDPRFAKALSRMGFVQSAIQMTYAL
ncbi:hypothetical protein RAZWK3B_16660 [Roseobacter sp. AzwK-3b]|uniref:GNAT family N-acetyltransferase n=1 Tax=Roseobacter sp. AzwK-3b TaxID=351016 RepID=UPI0001569884|nr:GNAT family N-acetyltransferase [Roseobacter sp. AzwK-3b]EDM71047.1 hypothetical protein RAZWK3B_16660 [Roseobacter sp. AzwK-3b]